MPAGTVNRIFAGFAAKTSNGAWRTRTVVDEGAEWRPHHASFAAETEKAVDWDEVVVDLLPGRPMLGVHAW